MKTNKLYRASDLLDKEFGIKGTKSRENFTKKAYAFYYGEIIKERRKELNLSQDQLAMKIGEEGPSISKIESGEDIQISKFLQIARALDLKLELLPA